MEQKHPSPEALREELRQRMADRTVIEGLLKAAMAEGDLAENAHYDAAKRQQCENESRIQELTVLLEHAASAVSNPGARDFKVLWQELQQRRENRRVLEENAAKAGETGGCSSRNPAFADACNARTANKAVIRRIEALFAKAEKAASLLFFASRDPAAAERQVELWDGDKDTFRLVLRSLEKAADQWDAEAQYLVGLAYRLEQGGWRPPVLAMKCFQAAAEQGHAGAQNRLALCYQEGNGADQDWDQALLWFRKAAEQGSAQAQYNLGLCCENGLGTEEDPAQAVFWYRKAADQHLDDALVRLALCCKTGSGVPKDPVQAVHLLQKTMEIGNPDAQYLMGRLYETGEGVEQDLTEALHWYRKAASQGHRSAGEHSLAILNELAPDLLSEVFRWKL